MVAELSFYDENIPCLAACPVHTNAGMYVAAIADGRDELAYLTARLPNPFASVCGRVCAAPCEDACRRGKIDKPIAIRALKRFVTEQFGPETGNPEVWQRVVAPPETERSESIGIVGGGPAGMAAAHDLRRLGYQVTVYEATDKLGGDVARDPRVPPRPLGAAVRHRLDPRPRGEGGVRDPPRA
ncbi:MAG: NAD(P)-binding protein [Ilumatobacteraceae bacterium]